MGEHSARTGDRRLNALETFFLHHYAQQPVTATFTGVHAYDAQLPDWSVAARAQRVHAAQAIRHRLNDEYPADPGIAELCASHETLDAELARAALDVSLAEEASGHFIARNPSLWTGEAIFGAVSLMIRDFAPVAERLPNLVSRLLDVPRFLTAMMQGVTEPMPSRWRDRAVRECDAAIGLFDDGLTQWLALNGVDGESSGVRKAAGAARDAFAQAGAWLAAQPVAEASCYACGPALLRVLLSRGHWCDDAPRDVLARAEAAMMGEQVALAEALASKGMSSVSEMQRALAADTTTAEGYYDTFQRRWSEVHAAASAHDVVTWPDWPIRYVPIPTWARAAQPALYWLFYRSPAPFDPYTEYHYVVTPIEPDMPAEVQAQRLAAWNRSTITLNHVVHHGGLGHHVQNWHAVHRSTSRIGTIAAVDAANRIAIFLGGSMAEGWACYATQLAEKLGVLTPLEQLSEQHTGVRLLARAIVDLRLHLGDWSFDTCVAYYEQQVGMSHDVATAETTKNSMFPATALMYWLGTQGILDARDQQRGALGSAFSLRAFHDALLSRGAIPVLLAARLLAHAASAPVEAA